MEVESPPRAGFSLQVAPHQSRRWRAGATRGQRCAQGEPRGDLGHADKAASLPPPATLEHLAHRIGGVLFFVGRARCRTMRPANQTTFALRG